MLISMNNYLLIILKTQYQAIQIFMLIQWFEGMKKELHPLGVQK